MKQNFKIRLIARFIFVAHILQAQDTNCLKNNSILATKIVGIGINDISYCLKENTVEKIYTINKTDILYKKNSNGFVDTIQQISAPSQTINQAILKKTMYGDTILIEGKKLFFEGRVLQNKELKFLIENYDDIDEKQLLLVEFNTLQRYKFNQHIVGTSILMLGFATTVVGTVSSINEVFYSSNLNQNESASYLIGSIFGGAIIRAAACAFATINKNKYWNKRTEIAKLYNNNL